MATYHCECDWDIKYSQVVLHEPVVRPSVLVLPAARPRRFLPYYPPQSTRCIGIVGYMTLMMSHPFPAVLMGDTAMYLNSNSWAYHSRLQGPRTETNLEEFGFELDKWSYIRMTLRSSLPMYRTEDSLDTRVPRALPKGSGCSEDTLLLRHCLAEAKSARNIPFSRGGRIEGKRDHDSSLGEDTRNTEPG